MDQPKQDRTGIHRDRVSPEIMTTSHRRWLIWIPLLAITVWLAFGADTPVESPSLETAPAQAPESRSPGARRGQQAPGPALQSLLPREALIEAGIATNRLNGQNDLFGAHSWAPRVAHKAPVPAPDPPPQAPPLPYTYLGKMLQDGVWEVYLSRGEETWLVRQGQEVEGKYRVDSIDPPRLVLNYLPLNQTQTLPIGDAP